MNDANESQLMRAYELIEAGKLDEARAIISPIVAKDRNNADAWWIYAHSVTDPLAAKDALSNVLRLDPEYPGARELNEQLNQQLVSAPEFAPPPSDVDMPDIDMVEKADDDEDGFNLPRVLLIAAVFLLIAIIGIVVASQAGQPVATPTAVANVTDTIPTADSSSAQVASTEAVAAGGDAMTVLSQALEGFTLRTTDPITLENTTAGTVAFANVCGAVNYAVLDDTINALKSAMGNASASLGSDVQLLGIRALDCTTDRVLVQIGVDTQTANAYAGGSLDETQFNSRWTAIQ